MTAKEYYELIERLDRFQKKLIPTIVIKDDNSPLISLKESKFFFFIFEGILGVFSAIALFGSPNTVFAIRKNYYIIFPDSI